MPIRDLLALAERALRLLLARTTTVRRSGSAGEIVTWVVLAAGLALIAVGIVLIVGSKLRAKAEGIELE